MGVGSESCRARRVDRSHPPSVGEGQQGRGAGSCRWGLEFVKAGALLLGYALLAWLSYQLIIPQTSLPAFWLANGLAIGVLVRSRLRVWPLLLAAVVVADLLVKLGEDIGPTATALRVLGNFIEIVVAAGVIRFWVGRDTSLSLVRDVLVFIFGCLALAPFASAVVTAFGPVPGRELPYQELLAYWWATDALGATALTSLFLTWVSPNWRLSGLSRSLETILVALGLAALLGLIFELPTSMLRTLLLVFATFPILSLTALYYGPRGASLIASAVGAMALWQTFTESAPFIAASFSEELLGVQAFFAFAIVSALLVAAVGEERRRLQESTLRHARAVEESASLLDAVIENAPIGFALFDRDLKVIRVNESLAKLNQIPVDGHVGKRVADIAPAVEESVLPNLRASLEGATIEGVEQSATPPGDDRLHTWLGNFYPVRINDGPVLGVGAWIIDITERRAKEDLLALSEERFRTLALATAELVWVGDEKGNVESTGWSEYTGKTPEELSGEGWLEAVHPEDRELAVAAWREAVEAKDCISVEYRLRRHDGAYRYHQVMAAPILDEEDEIREWVGMSFDISERKKAEAERIHLYQQAQEAIRARDEFLSIASHELKTPLTPLSTRLQILQRRAESGKSIDPKLIAKAQLSLKRLTLLINDLLDASRMQADRFSIRLEPMSLSEMVADQIAALAPAYSDHELKFEAPEEEIWVRGERRRLEQVLSNLVDNAIKYSPDPTPVEIRLSTRGGEAILSVTDWGIGIPSEQQRHLFQRFFRASSAEGYGGLGLGLYISRDIVERHGGRVWMRSKPGRGSTFSVALPLVQPGLRQLPAIGEGTPSV